MYDHSACTYHAATTDSYIIAYNASRAHPSTAANYHRSAQMCSDSNMAVILYDTVVINRSAGVYNTTGTNFRSRIDHSSCHYYCTASDFSILSNDRTWMDQFWKSFSCISLHQPFSCFCIPYGNKQIALGGIITSANNRPDSAMGAVYIVIQKNNVVITV